MKFVPTDKKSHVFGSILVLICLRKLITWKRTVFIPHACQQYLMNANWSLRYSSVILSFFSIYFVVNYFITRQVNIGIKIKGLPASILYQ